MIRLADSDQDITRCIPVMQQLRPHIPAVDFLSRIRRQMQQGYRLAVLERDGRVVALAGFRLAENLAWGRFLYVDDLITDETQRSTGAGKALFDWLVDYAHQHGCQALHLDSGVQRFDAHRFYLREGMHIAGHHFTLSLMK
ncbi:MAG TPA: GNAT family N-acetyltransferase [Gammaproteobacteria bacterium]|nr:GNAT family N-acetyltransferase [Gammaproteobacteria bacterium]